MTAARRPYRPAFAEPALGAPVAVPDGPGPAAPGLPAAPEEPRETPAPADDADAREENLRMTPEEIGPPPPGMAPRPEAPDLRVLLRERGLPDLGLPDDGEAGRGADPLLRQPGWSPADALPDAPAPADAEERARMRAGEDYATAAGARFSPRTELFIRAVAAGMSQAEAARYAGYAPAHARNQGYRLMQREAVRREIVRRRAAGLGARRAAVEALMVDLRELRERARDDRHYATVIRCLSLEARLIESLYGRGDAALALPHGTADDIRDDIPDDIPDDGADDTRTTRSPIPTTSGDE